MTDHRHVLIVEDEPLIVEVLRKRSRHNFVSRR